MQAAEAHSIAFHSVVTTTNKLMAWPWVLKWDPATAHINDHFLVYTSLKLKLPKSPSGSVNMRSYKNYDRDKFVEDLKQVSWHETALVDDVSEMLDHFYTNFLNVLEIHAPIKTVRIRPRCCPFVNTEIKELMRSRDGLLRNARRTGMPLDWELYRDLREGVKTIGRCYR